MSPRIPSEIRRQTKPRIIPPMTTSSHNVANRLQQLLLEEGEDEIEDSEDIEDILEGGNQDSDTRLKREKLEKSDQRLDFLMRSSKFIVSSKICTRCKISSGRL